MTLLQISRHYYAGYMAGEWVNSGREQSSGVFCFGVLLDRFFFG